MPFGMLTFWGLVKRMIMQVGYGQINIENTSPLLKQRIYSFLAVGMGFNAKCVKGCNQKFIGDPENAWMRFQY